jgi:hypothetical protein
MSPAALPAETRVLQALLRTDFRAFLEKVFNTLTPAQQIAGGILTPLPGGLSAFAGVRSRG